MTRLNEQQIAALLKPIKASRVRTEGGQAHVPAYDVAAHLTRVFGFGGWDTEMLTCNLLFEESETRTGKNKDGTPRTYQIWTVGYSATVRLIVKSPTSVEAAHWENGACGDAVNQPSRADAHHLAMTTAISTAMKRCAAFGLGDQFGLSLYNKGNTSALIGMTLVTPEGLRSGASPADLEAHIPVPESLGNDERQFEGASVTDITENHPSNRQSPPARPEGAKQERNESSAPIPLTSPLQGEIRAHAAYISMDMHEKGQFLSDSLGFTVRSLKDLSDENCEQVLAKLRTL